MAQQKAPVIKVKRSLRVSMIVFVISLIAVASLVFSLGYTFLETREVRGRAQDIADQQIQTMQTIGDTLIAEHGEAERLLLSRQINASNTILAARLIDKNGVERFSAVKPGTNTEVLQHLSELAEERSTQASKRTGTSIVSAGPIYGDNSSLVGWYAIETPFSAVSANWMTALLWGLALGCLISAAALPVVIILVNRMTKPLYQLIDFTTNFNPNHLSARVNLNTESEFDLLGESFNNMMHRLEGTMRQIQRLAFVDSVTELPNRERFLRALNKALSDRGDECFTAVILLNVDRFRWVNETLGPQKGDEALSLIGRRIRRALATADKTIRLADAPSRPSMVARLSGDEFAVLVPNIDAKSDITRLMQMIISSMRQPLELGGQAVTLGLSGGIALAPIHGMKGEDLVKNADLALKEARRAGRSKARFYSTKLNKIAMDRMHLEADLRRGIERDEFLPYFQAKIDFKTGRITGAEALVRWQREDGDLISPGIFIPMCEQLGLISQIGDSVLRKSCYEATRWMKAGHDCKVAVNVSPLQFEETGFAEKVLSSLRNAGLPPGRLELEITETMAVADTDRVSEIMRPLRAMGVRLAIDDFGAGHSNLVTLTKLPFDVFKIDQQFISALHSDKQAPAVVEMILAMADAMGLETVAEGVETPSQSDFLRRRGCTLAQGYLYSKPIPPEEFITFLADWRPFGQAVDEDVLLRFTGGNG